nr:uncharacterized protein LOC120966234 isoform X2 [Aegilops tauschii subsp. strangulata]
MRPAGNEHQAGEAGEPAVCGRRSACDPSIRESEIIFSISLGTVQVLEQSRAKSTYASFVNVLQMHREWPWIKLDSGNQSKMVDQRSWNKAESKAHVHHS